MTKASHFDIRYVERGGPPKNAASAMFPNGVDLDLSNGARQACLVPLPYPNPHGNIGMWLVNCAKCGRSVGVTAAARADDPRSVTVACQKVRRQ